MRRTHGDDHPAPDRDPDHLISLPDEVEHEVAAALLLQGLTADYLVEDSYAIRAGDRVVVHAAGGGVGLLLVQLATARGAEVLGLASSEPKRAAAAHAGAAHVASSHGDWVARVAERFPDGADAIYGSIGTTVLDSLRATRIGGTVVFYGMAAGPPPAVDPGSSWIARSAWAEAICGTCCAPRPIAGPAPRACSRVRAGRLVVEIDERFPLARGADAHRAIESRQRIGKLLLIP